MLTVFVPSTPTAFSGYMVMVPRRSVVELPITVEEAMRLLVTGGVISPGDAKAKSVGEPKPDLTPLPLGAIRPVSSSRLQPTPETSR
jgi:uncharacterized membrane protein